MTTDQRAETYYKFYCGKPISQSGGDYTVYRASRPISNNQSGFGFGDVLRSMLRHVIPVAAQGISSFLGSLIENKNQGNNWGASAKASIAPMAQAMAEQSAKQMKSMNANNDNQKQVGTGRKRRRARRSKGSKRKARVYKGKKRRARKRKINYSSDSAKLPKYNF